MSRRQVTILAVVLIVVAGVVALLVSAGSDEGDSGPSEPKLPVPPADLDAPSFVPSGSSNIYLIDVATGSAKQITKNDDDELASDPSWSERAGIVFSEAPGGEEQARLLIAQPDGRKEREVPTRITHVFQPTWAPDGRRVAVVLLGSGIYVVDTRSGSATRLERTNESDNAPAWSPDGETIVFERSIAASTNLELYAADPAGGPLKRLTRDPLQQSNAAWSPDGSRLVFAEQQGNGNWVLSSMKLDGSDRRLLTDKRLSSQEPAWSPDGGKIAFVLQEGARSSIGVIDADGGKPERVTPRFLVQVSHPVWSPDGKRIAVDARKAERPPPSAPG